MRFSTRSGLAILAVFALVLGAVALWMERELRQISSETLSDTAQLVGREIAAALTEPTLQQVLNSDPAATRNLMEIVQEVTKRSQMVTAVVVVDAKGTVIAGSEGNIGHQASMPQVIFDADPRPRFIVDNSVGQGERFLLFVPLLQGGHVEGYLRLSLQSDRLAYLHTRARRDLLLVGGVGVIGIALLSFLLHQQLAGVGGSLAGALQAAIRGEPIRVRRTGDEFARAFAAVEEVGHELTRARERGAQAQRRFRSLMQVMDVGVLLLGPNQSLDFANQHARLLLGGGDAGRWEDGWEMVRVTLEPNLPKAAVNPARVDINLPGENTAGRLRFEVYGLAEDDCEGYLVLVKNRDSIDALENELRLAIQMRGFARFYLAFAHDLKAPLNSMNMNLELLGRTLAANGDLEAVARQRRYIEVLRGDVSRLDRQLQTLLHQVSVPSTELQRFDLRDVLTDVAALLEPQAKQQRVAFQTRLPEGAVSLSGHRDRLKQALMNVAINALEAMPHGGQLAMELEQAEGRACIRIADSGPGIPPEVLEDIYEMHFTTKAGGTGIGLYVARSVVESHGGDISVASEPGRGTRFELTVPIDVMTA